MLRNLMKTSAFLAGIAALTACGSSSSSSLFDKTFEPAKGQAAVAITMTEVKGYWESKDNADGPIRIKIEDKLFTAALKCEGIKAVAQSSANSTLDTKAETITLSEELSDSTKSGDDSCEIEIPKGSKFSYTLFANALQIDFGGVQYTFAKLSDLP